LNYLAFEPTGAIVAAPPPVDDSLFTEPFFGIVFDVFCDLAFSLDPDCFQLATNSPNL
jgi:hypothetical protein